MSVHKYSRKRYTNMIENAESICRTCLSTDRRLLPLKLYESEIQNWIQFDRMEDPHICWECNAIIKKIHSFKMQVLKACSFFHNLKERKITIFSTLSNLNSVTNKQYDYFYNDPVKQETSDISDYDATMEGNVKHDFDVPEKPDSIDFNLSDTCDNAVINVLQSCDGDKKVYTDINYAFKTYISSIDNNSSCRENYAVTNTSINDYVNPKFNVNISNKFKVSNKNFDADNLNRNKITNLLDVHLNKDRNNLITVKKAQSLKDDFGLMDAQENTINKIDVNLIPEMNNVRVCDRYKVLYVNEAEMSRERQKAKECSKFIKTRYKCETCIIGYTVEEQYSNHMKYFHSDRYQVTCPICECRFPDENALDVHKESHYELFQCSHCSFTHLRRQRVIDHYSRNHLNQEFYKCSRCQLKFGTKSKLKQHRIKVHMTESSCDKCGKTFIHKQSLRLHMLQHTSDAVPKYQCELCNKYYKGKNGLGSHVRAIHANTKSEDAYCAECDIQFKGIYTYRSHLKVKHSSSRYECAHCGKVFSVKHYLKYHIQDMHLKTTKIVCELCDKQFVQIRNLRRHIVEVHERKHKPKTIICEICGKAFRTKQEHKQHLNSHTGSRPYKCDECSSTFSFHSALYLHTKLVHYKLKRSDKMRISLNKSK